MDLPKFSGKVTPEGSGGSILTLGTRAVGNRVKDNMKRVLRITVE